MGADILTEGGKRRGMGDRRVLEQRFEGQSFVVGAPAMAQRCRPQRVGRVLHEGVFVTTRASALSRRQREQKRLRLRPQSC